MSITEPFVPTHVVPPAGMRAWDQPDGTGAAAARLDPGLEVRVVDHKSDWANVVCSNGWTAWVDGRRLDEWTPPPARSVASTGVEVRGVNLLSLIGGLAVIAGSFLDWWSLGPSGVNAWDLPLGFVLAGETSDGFKTGPVLVVAAAVLGVAMLLERRLPSVVLLGVSLVALGLGGAATVRGLRNDPSINPDIGLILTLAGGALIAGDGLGFARRSARG